MTYHSPELDKLGAALCKAQAAIKHPKKNKENTHYGNDYADLTNVLDAVLPAFHANGLTITQWLNDSCLTTFLLHSSGQFISTEGNIPTHTNAQQLGSALTYLRRYTVQALGGVAAEVDDDGNAASVKAPPKIRGRKAKGKSTKKEEPAAPKKEVAETPEEDW